MYFLYDEGLDEIYMKDGSVANITSVGIKIFYDVESAYKEKQKQHNGNTNMVVVTPWLEPFLPYVKKKFKVGDYVILNPTADTITFDDDSEHNHDNVYRVTELNVAYFNTHVENYLLYKQDIKTLILVEKP